MRKNKIVSFFIIFVLFVSVSAVPSLSFADISQNTAIIADFSNGSVPEGVTASDQNTTTSVSMAIDTSTGYDGGSSLAWTIGNTTGLLKIALKNEWLEGYDTFNMRIYSKTPEQYINIPINEENTFSGGNDKGYYMDVDSVTRMSNFKTTGEWQTITVQMSELKKYWENQTPGYLYIRFNCNGWGITSGTQQQFEDSSTVNNNKVAAIQGEKLYIDSIYLEKSASGALIDFEAISSSPQNGEENIQAYEGGYEVSVVFNSKLPGIIDNEYVNVLENGSIYDDYSLLPDNQTLKIVFANPLEAETVYTVKILEGLPDIYGNELIKPFELSFKTSKVSVTGGGVSVIDDTTGAPVKSIYTSASSEYISKASSNSSKGAISEETAEVNFYPSTTRLNYAVSSSSSAWLLRSSDYDTTDMNYINYWIYQSNASDMALNFAMYFGANSEYGFVQYDANWSGWRLVSIPLVEFETGETMYNGLVVNVGGWSVPRDEAGFVLIDDVWLSGEAPAEINLVNSTLADGSENVKVSGTELELTFTEHINTRLKPEISVDSENGESFSDFEVKQSGDKLTVSFGDFAPSTTYSVNIKNIYSVQAVAGSDVNFTFTTASLYLTKEQQEELLKLSNTNDKDSLEDFLAENKEYFDLTAASDELISDIAYFITSGEDFESHVDVEAEIVRIKTELDKFNENKKLWANVTGLVNSNPDFFGGEEDKEHKYFINLSTDKQNEVSIIMCRKLPAESISELDSFFEAAVDSYKDSLNKNDNKKGGSSGGGGGSGRVTSSAVIDAVYAEELVSGKPQNDEPFIDLENISWAKDSILSLHKAGIISSSADKLFRPNDNITREEFAKLLVCAFAQNASNEYHSFSDAPQNAWYTEYLSKGYNSGISLGYPDGSFGVGKSITREDMVTMACRAANVSSDEMTAETQIAFTDSGSISDYALESVMTLSSAGIVNGMADGTFAPKAFATRAQAAKIIAMLISSYK